MTLSNDKLIETYGGGAKKYGLLVTLGGIIALVVGIIDGYLRPLKCNK